MKTPFSQSSATTPNIAQDIESRLLHAAYARKPLNLLMTVGITLIITGLLWRLFAATQMTLWSAAILTGVALGYVECWAFKRARPDRPAIARWQKIFLAQSTLAGLTWALGPCLMIAGAAGEEQTLFVTILLAVCTVAMISVAEQRLAMQAFVAAVLAPPALVLASTGGEVERMVALALACGMVLMILVGGRFNQTLRDLLETQGRTRAILDTAMDAVIAMDAQGRITDWNLRAESIFGWTRSEAIGLGLHDTIVPAQHRQAHRAGLARFLASGESRVLNRRIEMTAVRRNAEEFPVELAIVPFRNGNDYEFTAFLADITGRKRAALAMQESEERFRTLIEWSPTAIGVHSGGLVRYANPAALKLFGAASAQDLVGKPILDRIHPDFHQIVLARVKRGMADGTPAPMIEEKFLRLDGSVIDVEVQGTPIVYDGVPAVRFAMHDVSERNKAQHQIETLAFYDPLTGLPNRRLLMDRLQQALSASARHPRTNALLFVDLDNFKTLNDTLGHLRGDLLLEQVARRLRSCAQDGDTVARLGGDKFALMLEDLSQDELEAATRAETMGEKILAALDDVYQLGNHEHRNTASVGITLFDGDASGRIDEPLKRAELAMYQAKAAGRNTVRFFDPQIQAEVAARTALEADLREALLKSQLTLHFQAQIAGDGELTGVEALVRWRHRGRGVMPTEFIALAEQTGLIVPLGQWVLDTACNQLARWAGDPVMADLSVAVNVSPYQFRDKDFVDKVLATLERAGASPKRLKLELTESLLLDDVDAIIATMNALKAQGVSFSLDDFGTGYSSLSYLKRLPLDQLKIDQSFIKNILTDANDAAIARMIIALAGSLGLSVIAEGVESLAQRDFLAREGCLAYQGYFFSRPLPINDFESYARQLAAARASALEGHFDDGAT